MITLADADWMRAFVYRNRWVFAKTMPEHPHEYAVRERVANDADFDRFVSLIRENGYQRPFFKHRYVSFDLDHWTYWTMGAPLYNTDGSPCTIIINRATANPYHTALGKTPELTSFEASRVDRPNGSIAFVHDIMWGLTPEYDECDVFYSDLPWAAGWEKFQHRAGIYEPVTFKDFMAAVSRIIEETAPRPAIIVTGMPGARQLPAPTESFPIKLNGEDALALCYRIGWAPPRFETTEELLADLTRAFWRVGDFCCGYGRTGRIFRQHDKAYTMSDINAKCIGYIALNAQGWKTAALPKQSKLC